MSKTIKDLFKKAETIKKPIHHCVQCLRPFEASTDDLKYMVCVREECPNYGLLQLGQEKMDEFLKSINEKESTITNI